MAIVGAVTAVASLAYTVYSTDAMQRQAGHAVDTENQRVAAEVSERNRLTAEHVAEVTAEAERERSLAISNQEAQNVRVNALAAEAAANEKAIAQNILERSQEEALITRQDAAREQARIQDLQAQTEGRQIAALAAGGVGDGSGTARAILLDTKTRANKDISALNEAATSKTNLLQKEGAFAVEQGDVSSRNILETAAHNTETNLENVKNAADTLVANAKISGATETSAANLQNLLAIGSAQQFGEQVDRLRSEANAKMWGSILSGTGQLADLYAKTNKTTPAPTTPVADTYSSLLYDEAAYKGMP